MSPIILGILGVVLALIGFFTWKAPRLTSVILWALIASMLFSAAAAPSAVLTSMLSKPNSPPEASPPALPTTARERLDEPEPSLSILSDHSPEVSS